MALVTFKIRNLNGLTFDLTVPFLKRASGLVSGLAFISGRGTILRFDNKCRLQSNQVTLLLYIKSSLRGLSFNMF